MTVRPCCEFHRPHNHRAAVPSTTQPSRSDPNKALAIANRLDANVFPPFSQLLNSCEDYCRFSGSRFRSASFDKICENDTDIGDESSELSDLAVGPHSSDDAEPRVAAKLRALSSVREFAQRVRAGEPELIQELDTAFALLMSESVRNAMVATCRKMDLWPPPPSLLSSAVDMGASRWADALPVPLLAHRLYEEDIARRTADEGGAGVEDQGAAAARAARTAAFLVDFAAENGVRQPEMAEAQARRLSDFSAHAAEWEHRRQMQCSFRESPRRSRREHRTWRAAGTLAATSLAHFGARAAVGWAGTSLDRPRGHGQCPSPRMSARPSSVHLGPSAVHLGPAVKAC